MQDITSLPDAGSELAIKPAETLSQAQPRADDRKWIVAITASCLLHAAAAAVFLISPAGTFDSSNAIQSEGSDQSGADVVGSELDSPDAVDVELVTDPQPAKPEVVRPVPPTEAPQPARQPAVPKPAPEAAEQATHAPDTPTAAIPNDQTIAPTAEESTPPAVQAQSMEAPPAEQPPVDLPAAGPPVPSPRPTSPAGSGEARGAADGEERDAQVIASKGKEQAGTGNAMESRYSGEIQKKLGRANRRVSKAIQEKASKNARVVFVVMADGSVGDVQLAESSGSAELDQFALKLVRQQAPFPPIPPETGRSSWVFRVRIGSF